MWRPRSPDRPARWIALLCDINLLEDGHRLATFRAIAAASEAVVRLLRSHYRAELFDGNELEFRVFGPQDFRNGASKPGVSLFVYRVMAEGTHRTPGVRRGSNGRLQRSELPIEVHFLLTAWAEDPSLQNTIAGWMMRTLEDTPTLPSTLLNAVWSDVFRPDEGLEVVLGDLSTEDLFHVWDVITENNYQLFYDVQFPGGDRGGGCRRKRVPSGIF